MKQWFLQRNERFYGPFTLEKVKELLQSGRVTLETLASSSKSGKDARPLSEVPPFSGEEPMAPAASSKPVQNKPGEDGWMIVDDEDNPRGPYKLAQLQKLLAAGKLKPQTRVSQQDSTQVMALSILVPATPPPELSAPKPPREPRRRPAPKPATAPKSKLVPAIIGVSVVIALIAVGIAFLPEDKKKGLGFMEKIESSIQEKPSLTKIIKERRGADPPQYGTMVEKALRTGLNFKAEEVLRYNRDDLLIFDKQNAFEYAHLYPQTRREVRFSSDGGLSYTYLMDGNNFVFAVVISGGNLNNHRLSHSSLADFSTTAKPPLELPDQTIWQTDITQGIIAKAVWSKRKNKEHYLDYVLVTSKEAEGK